MEEIKLSLAYQDSHVVVVNKPFGMLSQADKQGSPGVYEILQDQIGQPFLAMMQRLDRVAGGLMVFAKTSDAAKHLKLQFEKRQVQKTYLAVVEGVFDEPEARVTHYLKKMPRTTRVRAYDEKVKGSKEAILGFKVMKVEKGRSLLSIHPETGRMHQIRVQMAKVGHPIVGDKKYGKTKFLADKSIMLFSKSIRFNHPDKGNMTIAVDMPDHEVFNEFQA